jgi:4-amino-4-deoxy-L-arabinose transferase-like glycosyltransferase
MKQLTDRRWEKWAIVAITLLAFAARVWQLDSVPLGWRDDELINSLVISQKVLDGDWQLFYPDASGNEGFYFVLNAPMLALFGANFVGMRLLSVYWGLTAVPLTWLLGRKLFGRWVGLLAAAGMAVSFWSLMYSRFALRQIVTPTLLLLAFYFFWRALTGGKPAHSNDTSRIRHHASRITDYGIAGFWLALGFYVYFAGRGAPLIVVAFCLYLAVVAWPLLRREWRGIGLMLLVTAVLVVPLFISIQRQPEAEARVGELAGPIIAASEGDFSLIEKHVIATMSMFHADGDDEWLYNIPHRPAFGVLGALAIWSGVLIALVYALKPLVVLWRRRGQDPTFADYGSPITDYRLPAAFLLIWWLVGLSPGFISVPPASLGHTILALPATYLLWALPVGWVVRQDWGRRRWVYTAVAGAAVVLLLTLAVRDFTDYFREWPARGMVRFLYRSEIAEVAAFLPDYVAQHPEAADFAIAGLLAGPWDRLALEADLPADTAVRPRWYDPQRAAFVQPALAFRGYPDVPEVYADWFASGQDVGAYELSQMTHTAVPDTSEATCFSNGLCLVAAEYDAATGRLELGWWVQRPLELPPFQLISNPPPPGVDARPRLVVFGQLLAEDGTFLTGDDGLWVDPYSLQPGDLFVQQHWLQADGAAQVAFGLYDPVVGVRILTDDGRDALTIDLSIKSSP